jgi:osmotically-inducible protein OsmY
VRGVLDVAEEIDVRYGGPEVLTDTDLAQAVRRALEWDASVDHRRIQSTVSEGFVTLEGQVAFLSQREGADHAIRKLKGVRGVLNKIQVKPVQADSAALRRRIEEALERRAEREADCIRVQVHNGTVTLTGRVHSWQERDSVCRRPSLTRRAFNPSPTICASIPGSETSRRPLDRPAS